MERGPALRDHLTASDATVGMGKVERFIQTLLQEWAYSRSWPTSSTRTRSLLASVRYENRRRPHSSRGDRPPLSHVHNVCSQFRGVR